MAPTTSSTLQIIILAAVGGILGVLFMVPLRRSLIVAEHKTLPYPEGTACADVLIAGERGGRMAGLVFGGVALAVVYKALNVVFAFWKDTVAYVTPLLTGSGKSFPLPNATVAAEVSPELLGVGYILGPRIGGIMVSGSVLSWVVLIPLFTVFLSHDRVVADLLAHGTSQAQIDAWAGRPAKQIYEAYVRYIGAGAVTMAGIITLLRSLPTILRSVKESFASLGNRGVAGQLRTERDIPITVVLGGALVLALIMVVLPILPSVGIVGKLVMAGLMLVFGFLFVTVSSRIVGLIGSSQQPDLGHDHRDSAGHVVGVPVAAQGRGRLPADRVVGRRHRVHRRGQRRSDQPRSQDRFPGGRYADPPAGRPDDRRPGVDHRDRLHDHRPGFGLCAICRRARHRLRQAPCAAGAADGHRDQGCDVDRTCHGSTSCSAPRLAVTVWLCGVSPLAWAVGAYLPIGTTFPIFVGGMLRAGADRLRGDKESSELSSGMLFATGLVAGGTLTGVASAVLKAVHMTGPGGAQVTLADVTEKSGVGFQQHLIDWAGSTFGVDFGRYADGIFATACYMMLCAVLLFMGTRRSKTL